MQSSYGSPIDPHPARQPERTRTVMVVRRSDLEAWNRARLRRSPKAGHRAIAVDVGPKEPSPAVFSAPGNFGPLLSTAGGLEGITMRSIHRSDDSCKEKLKSPVSAVIRSHTPFPLRCMVVADLAIRCTPGEKPCVLEPISGAARVASSERIGFSTSSARR